MPLVMAPNKARQARLGVDLETAVALISPAADIILIIDGQGLIANVAVRDYELSQFLGDVALWRGKPYQEAVTQGTRATMDSLMREASSGAVSRPQHVDHTASGGVGIPILYSAMQVGNQRHVIFFGRSACSIDLVELLLRQHDAAAYSSIMAMRARGIAPDTLCNDVLAPVARRLGDLWTEDLCSFADVTEGLGHLHRILREIHPESPNATAPSAKARRVLLAPASGEQHTLGLAMVAAYFRGSGWNVQSEFRSPKNIVLDKVRTEVFDVIGYSASSDRLIEALAFDIAAIRRATRNPRIIVLVGGHPFVENPALVSAVGADATALDGRRAVLQAETLLEQQNLVTN